MERGRVAFLLILLFLFPLVALSQDYGDAIVLGSIGEPKRLLPPLAVDSASGFISGLIFNGLVRYDGDLNLVGDLAENWEVKEGGKVVIFHLRKGVKWQDGYPFTADDVIFN